jgi:hypothetical protein
VFPVLGSIDETRRQHFRMFASKGVEGSGEVPSGPRLLLLVGVVDVVRVT